MAASHFEGICDYIAKDSNYYAVLFARKIVAIVKSIPQFPKSGRVVPEYNDENLREKLIDFVKHKYGLDFVNIKGVNVSSA